ncbi:MAG TPA: ABC-F family ATP-binding cassette domain-containing protein, partial [Candidatus Saccharimonadales bacterium]|nr:ABC-F family ATP-binding cassette domain-containing protein [Candidatus Saccharimonadales bacterium]
RGLRMGLLSQEAHLDAAFMAAPNVRAAVRHGAPEIEAMERELAELEQAHRVTEPAYADLQHRFDVLGGYSLDQRVDAALSGLGFTLEERDRPPTSLSGGEQTRAALARLVISDPDLLLLDEPTNHLDLDALEWLEEHLRRRGGSLLVASHDRAFLDATVTRIWELRGRRLTAFRGNYSAYHRQGEQRDERAVKDAGTQTDRIVREKELIQRYRSHRNYSKMHEHEARLERLEVQRIEAPRAARRLALPATPLTRAAASRGGTVVVQIEDLVAGYQAEGRRTKVALAPWLAAQRGERIGIVGPNGAGKTTLLRTIAGDLPPIDGGLTFGSGVQIGYLAQLREAGLPGTTVLESLLSAMPVTQGEARGYLARFLFRGDDVDREVRMLSGGERSRLELALMGITPANLMLLDEPTNHLDIPAREAIEAFIRESPATFLIVSHDRRLLDTLCDRLWVVADGLAVPFDGGYRDWRAAMASGWTVASAAEVEARRMHRSARRTTPERTDPAEPANDRDGVEPPPGVKGRRRGGANGTRTGAAAGAAAGATSAAAAIAVRAAPTRLPKLSKDAYRRQRAMLDAELTRLGLRKNHLELALGDPAAAANFVELRRITSELADVSEALEAAENGWLEIEERAP